MRTFICGLHPRGAASQSGLGVGDLLVKVGEVTVWDRCHLNVTTIIKNLSSMGRLPGPIGQAICAYRRVAEKNKVDAAQQLGCSHPGAGPGHAAAASPSPVAVTAGR